MEMDPSFLEGDIQNLRYSLKGARRGVPTIYSAFFVV